MHFQLPLPFTVEQVHDYMMATYSVTPKQLYCGATGQGYATVSQEEIESLIRFVDEDDLETFCDDLFVRMIAGMRPCMMWSRIEPASIEFARHNDKAGLLAYLIHRANETKSSADLTFQDIMTRNHARILSYEAIDNLVESGVDVFELMQLLLQADSIGNLHRFTQPLVARNEHGRLERVKKHTLGVTSLFHVDHLNKDDFPALVTHTRTWVEDILDVLDKETRVAMADARFAATQGNRLTVTAYTRSWMEKPVSALSRERQAKNAPKKAGLLNKDGSTSKSRVRKMMSDEAANSILAEVEQMLKGPDLAKSIAASAPKPKPVLRFGAKK